MCEKISFWRLFKGLFHFILNNYKNTLLHINKPPQLTSVGYVLTFQFDQGLARTQTPTLKNYVPE